MNNNNSNNNNSPRSRRDFLKRIGLGATVTGLALAGCESAGRKAAGGLSSSVAVPDGKMTYRTKPKDRRKGVDTRIWLHALADKTRRKRR